MSDERTRDEKVQAFKDKFPECVAALTAIVLPIMGVHARTRLAPETLEAMAAPHVDALIAASWGLE